MTPGGIEFGRDSKYDELVRVYQEVIAALPKIDGWRPEDIPMDLDEIAQNRMDAKEIGEISAEVAVEQQIERPGRELADYRHRLNKKRRQLIRNAISDLIARVDESLNVLHREIPTDAKENQILDGDPNWDSLKNSVQAIDTLLGSSLPRPSGWEILRRHLYFAMVKDLKDIVRSDWPTVKSGLTRWPIRQGRTHSCRGRGSWNFSLDAASRHCGDEAQVGIPLG